MIVYLCFSSLLSNKIYRMSVVVYRRVNLRIFVSYVNSAIKCWNSTESKHVNNEVTHFGFDTVNIDEKENKVYSVFENVANSYDNMNDAMSFGIHRLWKDKFMLKLSPSVNTQLLDVAGGTGDIAFRFLRYLDNCFKDHDKMCNANVTVCDINRAMLDVGQKRAQGLCSDSSRIKWVEGNAEMLPFKDSTFSAYTIAFGIRNVTRIEKVLEEAYRVLTPGGRFLCLEFSHVNNSYIRWAYDQYSFQIIPVMGQLIAGQWKPYQYLVESIRQFPDQEDFKIMIENAGFRKVTYENLSFGVVAIHSGFKI